MLRILCVALMVFGLAIADGARAQPPAARANPVVVALNQDDGDDALSLPIARLDIVVEIVGASARTVVTAQFHNPTERVLEGGFTLDLPPGSAVTGYALDVGDVMVNGVLVGRRKGTEAYEEKVRQGVDPGLAEVTREGAFHTRVYPMMPGKDRTIRLEFVSPLGLDGSYALPLLSKTPVGQVSLKASVEGSGGPPPLQGPDGLALAWVKSKRGFEASASSKGAPLSGALRIGPVERAAPVVMSRHRNGEVFFEIDDVARGEGESAVADRVRIYWDTSLSRRDDDLNAEIGLLRRYLEAAGAKTIDLVLFADGEPTVRRLTSGAEVEAALKAADYRGATSMAGLSRLKLPRTDVCLYVSDGAVTLDPYQVKGMGCPLFAISSAPDADRAFLEALARKSGGDYIDLKMRPADAALAIMLRQAPRVASVTAADGQDISFRALPAQAGRFRIVGRAPSSGQVTVRLVGAWNGVRTYGLDAVQPRKHDGAGTLWALGQLADKSATDEVDQDALVAFARRYSVASPAAVFVVLETAEDYAEADIEPPANAPAELMADYRRLASERRREEAEERDDRLTDIVEAWEEQKTWWNKRFLTRAPRPAKPVAGDEDALARPVPPPPPPPPPSTPSPDIPASDPEALIVTAQKREEAIQDVPLAISAFSQEDLSRSQVAGGPDLLTQVPGPPKAIGIEIEEWDPDRPYLKALSAAAPEALWDVLRAQERQYGQLPAFYLDVGEWLFRAGRAGEARSVVLSALELPAADIGTLAIVADRMMRYGDRARSLWLYEKILALDPSRPQPRRNLALALIDGADTGAEGAEPRRDYKRAFDLLKEVVLTPWDNDYDGIELIALMEANRLVPRLRALGIRPDLDPRLIALLDVDLRVVLEWSTNHTDMDLWVLEPTGEQAIFSNPLTAIGGRLSNDMTEGYGPEEYLLRRAPDGRYEVRVNVYSVDELNPNGSTIVRARVYRAWGRPDEHAETLELELLPDMGGAQLVGVVTVGR